MSWFRFSVALLTFSVTGCSTLRDGAQSASSAAASQVWEYPASEFPTMCLVFKPGGSAQFIGGFLYFNPSSWRVNASSGLTVLTVGGGALPLPTASTSSKAVVRHDSRQRTVEYRIDAETRSIDFGGYLFYRKDRCSLS